MLSSEKIRLKKTFRQSPESETSRLRISTVTVPEPHLGGWPGVPGDVDLMFLGVPSGKR